MSWLKKLKSGLGKTSARVTASLGAVLGRKGIDAGLAGRGRGCADQR
jgi:hypothetical protein